MRENMKYKEKSRISRKQEEKKVQKRENKLRLREAEE
jgi:hypothetical protein